MSITRFPHGISSFGIPQLGSGALTTTGNVFFVDDSGSNDNDGLSPEHPFSTLDYAISRCTASHGDVVIVMPGHAETAGATGVGLDIAGVSVIGLGQGRARPAITAHASAAADLIAVSANNCYIENLRLVGGAAGTTALIDVGGEDFKAVNCVLEHGAAPLKAVTIPAAGLRSEFLGCTFRGTAAGPDYGIFIESSTVTGLTVKDCDFLYYDSAGLDNAGIASAYTNENILIYNCRFLGMDLTAVDFDSSAQGLMAYCTGVTTAGASLEEMMDTGDLGVVRNFMCAEGGDASGTEIPAATTAA